MTMIPLYCCVPSGALRDAVGSALGDAVEFMNPPFEALTLTDRAPGIVLLDVTGMTAETLLEVPRILPPPKWVVGTLVAGDPPSVRVLSVGPSDPLPAVGEHAADPDARGDVLLELNRVLAEVARARHDINNPLTSALAETQILLLDAEEGETREALDAIQTQLRRIRDLVAATRHLRPRE
jgi:signal transduction histidine kinase